MVNSGLEGDLGRLEGVVRRELNIKEKDAACVGRVIGAHNGGLPLELVVLVNGSSRAVSRRVTTQVHKFFADAFKCHVISYFPS